MCLVSIKPSLNISWTRLGGLGAKITSWNHPVFGRHRTERVQLQLTQIKHAPCWFKTRQFWLIRVNVQRGVMNCGEFASINYKDKPIQNERLNVSGALNWHCGVSELEGRLEHEWNTIYHCFNHRSCKCCCLTFGDHRPQITCFVSKLNFKIGF